MSSAPLELGYSFCPNDTFIFYALQAGLIATPAPIRETLKDVQTLNHWAAQGRLPITKISYRAYFDVLEHYVALRAGGALGLGVGPLVVAREPLNDLNGQVVASPGAQTTAELLLRLKYPEAKVAHYRFDEVMPAVARGDVAAGLIIHESRFTYAQHGLVQLHDLGAWWLQETGLPLPLGAILLRRDLAAQWGAALNEAVRQSILYARAHPDEATSYIRQHALELSDEAIWSHIDLYVNEFSLDVGTQGTAAVQELYRRAVAIGAVQPRQEPLFVIPEETRETHTPNGK